MSLPANPVTPPTRHRVVDANFAAVLEERFCIPTAFVLRALEGEPHQRAVELCRLAARYRERNGTLLMLAHKFGRGRARRPRTTEPVLTPPRGQGELSPVVPVDHNSRQGGSGGRHDDDYSLRGFGGDRSPVTRRGVS